jgi:hypothetical protein
LRRNPGVETALSNVEQGKEEDLADIGAYLNQQGFKNFPCFIGEATGIYHDDWTRED